MIERITNPASLQSITLSDLVDYLPLRGWTRSSLGDRHHYVFETGRTRDGDPIEIVLPRNPQSRDFAAYVSNAIEILAALDHRSPNDIITMIRARDRDILLVRNLDTGDEQSISLDVAAKQIHQLTQLIVFSARAEQGGPKPFFEQNELTSAARRIAKRYRFGHTFPGSFGLSIEAPFERPVVTASQLYLLPDGDDIVFEPIERRVLERIVRGLIYMEELPRHPDEHNLERQYTLGLNSNMCQAVARMAPNKTAALEYRVEWSPQIAPPADIANPGSIRLSQTSYSYLTQLAGELKNFEPKPIVLRGRVEGLVSRDNPLSMDTDERSIIVKWTDRPGGRPVRVIMRLSAEDYVKANEAHMSWQTIEVTGILRQVGSVWHLWYPKDFHLV
jgi:hypothetical protein